MRLGAFILLVCAALIAIGSCQRETPEAKQARVNKEQQENGIAELVVAMRRLQRNPDSFKVESAYLGKNDSKCLTYRGQNGFGGMTRGSAVSSGSKAYHDQEPGFRKLWNSVCLNVVRDLTRFAEYNVDHGYWK